MSFFHGPKSLTSENKQQAVRELLGKTTHGIDYYVLLVGAIFLAANAIFADSIVTLIASMIVAPLAYPILAFGLGVVAYDWRLVVRSLIMLGVSAAVTLALAVVLTMLIGNDRVVDKFVTFGGSGTVAVVVALVSGAIAAYGMVKPKVATAMTGVAVAVSLLPPLVATGVALAPMGNSDGGTAFATFLLNVAGISIASICVFKFFGMGKEYRNVTRGKEQRLFDTEKA